MAGDTVFWSWFFRRFTLDVWVSYKPSLGIWFHREWLWPRYNFALGFFGFSVSAGMDEMEARHKKEERGAN